MNPDKGLNSSTKLLASNTVNLTVVQIAIYLAPVVLLPFLTRTLGPGSYGVYAAGFALFAVLATLSDFGFSAYGPLLLASRLNHWRVRSLILSAVTVGRFAVSIPLSFVPPLLALLVEGWRSHVLFFAFIGLAVLVNSLLPIWFFQGIQETGSIVLGTFMSRVLFVVFVLIFVSNGDDLWKAAAANVVSLTIAVMVYFVVLVRRSYRFVPVRRGLVQGLLRSSKPFFYSRGAVVLYTSAFPVVIGVSSSSANVAVYSVSDQLYRTGLSLGSPFVQALLPHAVRQKSLRGPVIGALAMFGFASFVYSIFSLFGQTLIPWFVGPGFADVIPVLRILLLALLFSAPSQVLGFPAFGALGAIKYANFSVYLGGLLAFLLVVGGFVFGTFDALFAAWSVILVEALVLALRIYWLCRISRRKA